MNIATQVLSQNNSNLAIATIVKHRRATTMAGAAPANHSIEIKIESEAEPDKRGFSVFTATDRFGHLAETKDWASNVERKIL